MAREGIICKEHMVRTMKSVTINSIVITTIRACQYNGSSLFILEKNIDHAVTT